MPDTRAPVGKTMIGAPGTPLLTVYTALMGDYEPLQEQCLASTSSARFLCYTDNPALTSDTWDVRLVEPRFPWDPTRSAREIKICPPPEVRSAEVSLWVDNRVRLLDLPEHLVPSLLRDADIALPLHSFRATVGDEFAAVVSHGFDRKERVREQLHYMRTYEPEVLDQAPYWTAIIARRHGSEVDAAMYDWWCQVLRHSRRDQLSVNWALSRHPDLTVNPMRIDNFKSGFHEWLSLPKAEGILKDYGYRYSVGEDFRDRWSSSRFGEFASKVRLRSREKWGRQ